MRAIKSQSVALLDAMAAALPNMQHHWIGLFMRMGCAVFTADHCAGPRIHREEFGRGSLGRGPVRLAKGVSLAVDRFNTLVARDYPQLLYGGY